MSEQKRPTGAKSLSRPITADGQNSSLLTKNAALSPEQVDHLQVGQVSWFTICNICLILLSSVGLIIGELEAALFIYISPVFVLYCAFPSATLAAGLLAHAAASLYYVLPRRSSVHLAARADSIHNIRVYIRRIVMSFKATFLYLGAALRFSYFYINYKDHVKDLSDREITSHSIQDSEMLLSFTAAQTIFLIATILHAVDVVQLMFSDLTDRFLFPKTVHGGV